MNKHDAVSMPPPRPRSSTWLHVRCSRISHWFRPRFDANRGACGHPVDMPSTSSVIHVSSRYLPQSTLQTDSRLDSFRFVSLPRKRKLKVPRVPNEQITSICPHTSRTILYYITTQSKKSFLLHIDHSRTSYPNY